MSNFYTAGAAAMTSNKDDWETPQKLFDQLNEEFPLHPRRGIQRPERKMRGQAIQADLRESGGRR